mmetsp:Transcript_8117/g.25292  ORF Transcript_8117/g.25292 Transcript_8117/m.25292 type:complete len:200 (-) Transcript_8117:162-761(-)
MAVPGANSPARRFRWGQARLRHLRLRGSDGFKLLGKGQEIHAIPRKVVHKSWEARVFVRAFPAVVQPIDLPQDTQRLPVERCRRRQVPRMLHLLVEELQSVFVKGSFFDRENVVPVVANALVRRQPLRVPRRVELISRVEAADFNHIPPLRVAVPQHLCHRHFVGVMICTAARPQACPFTRRTVVPPVEDVSRQILRVS